LPQGPLRRKRASGPGKHQNGVKSAPMIGTWRNSAIWGLTSVPNLALSRQIPTSAACRADAGGA
jgi:hypothetical protein